jgi:hypothetical protein
MGVRSSTQQRTRSARFDRNGLHSAVAMHGRLVSSRLRHRGKLGAGDSRRLRAVTPFEEQRELESDIQRFLDEHANDLDSAFEETFTPEIIASAFSGSTRSFMEEVRDLLEPAAP